MKNVLITLGDSFTQGDGCWDLSILDKEFGGKSFESLSNKEESRFFKLNEDRFLNLGWPSRLQEMLGYDELYNLGFGGASISHSIKILMDSIYYNDFSDCNVLLIHMMSFPDRISFYKNSTIQTSRTGSPLHDSYIKEVNTGGIHFGNSDDTTLEAYFYMKILKELCNSKGWDFLFCSARGDENDHMNSYRDKQILRDNYMTFESILDVPIHQKSTICSHPNENGYLDISKKLFRYIIDTHPNIKIGSSDNFKKVFVRANDYNC